MTSIYNLEGDLHYLPSPNPALLQTVLSSQWLNTQMTLSPTYAPDEHVDPGA